MSLVLSRARQEWQWLARSTQRIRRWSWLAELSSPCTAWCRRHSLLVIGSIYCISCRCYCSSLISRRWDAHVSRVDGLRRRRRHNPLSQLWTKLLQNQHDCTHATRPISATLFRRTTNAQQMYVKRSRYLFTWIIRLDSITHLSKLTDDDSDAAIKPSAAVISFAVSAAWASNVMRIHNAQQLAATQCYRACHRRLLLHIHSTVCTSPSAVGLTFWRRKPASTRCPTDIPSA